MKDYKEITESPELRPLDKIKAKEAKEDLEWTKEKAKVPTWVYGLLVLIVLIFLTLMLSNN